MPQKSNHLTLIQECQAHPANHLASLRHCPSAMVPGPEVGMPRSSRDSKASGRNGLRITAFYSSRIISQGLLGSDGGAEAVRTRVWGAVEPTASQPVKKKAHAESGRSILAEEGSVE